MRPKGENQRMCLAKSPGQGPMRIEKEGGNGHVTRTAMAAPGPGACSPIHAVWACVMDQPYIGVGPLELLTISCRRSFSKKEKSCCGIFHFLFTFYLQN